MEAVRIGALVLATSLVMATVAAGAPPEARAETNEQVKKLFVSATRHFDLTEYPEALNDFREAYRLKDDPVFLYDIAQCYRLMDKTEEALRFYRTYLRRLPEAKNRAEVETKIATLQEIISTQERARWTSQPDLQARSSNAGEPTVTTPPLSTSDPLLPRNAPEHKEPLYKKWWLWTAVGGVVVVGLAVGLAVGLSQSGSGEPPVSE